MQFLMGIDPVALKGVGVAYTLTVRDLPDTAADFARRIDLFRKWLARRGAYYDHWCIEWTKARRPHVHGMTFVDPARVGQTFPLDLVEAWLSLTEDLGTLPRGQHVAAANGIEGWLRYVSKHAGRGYAHYQREKDALPDGWQKAGRMWGASRSFPTTEYKVHLDKEGWFRFRRLVRSYLVAEARSSLHEAERRSDHHKAQMALKSLRYRRSMLSRNTRAVAEVRGLSEWAPQDVTEQFILYLGAGGHVRPD